MGNPRIRLASFLRRWWFLIALAVVGGALAAYVYGSRATPTYEANAKVLVEADPESGGTTQAAELVPTYAEMVRSTPVLAFALRRTGSPGSVDELRENVRAESDQDTRLIEIRADDTDPTRAVALANQLTAGLKWYLSVTQVPPTPGAHATKQPLVRVVDRETSAARVRPRSLLLLEFGALAGLFGALAFALVAETRRPNVTDEVDLMEIGGLPVLGSVNGARPRAGQSSFDPTRSSLEEAASYRRLVTRISVANREEIPGSLVVVGAERSEGSCTVGVKLALALAQDGWRVVLADFEGGRIRPLFGVDERGGGSRFVSRAKALKYRETTLDCFTLRSGAPLVFVLPRLAPRGLSHEEAEELVTLLSVDADLLIIHAPPPSHSRSTLTWARAARATVLVVRAEHTKRVNVTTALQGLEPVGKKLIGAVLQTGRD
ncbi:MAG TPA: Wzz/FepE/Etk N-terminal domain-containing protein [Gaiellaceae bacterium]|nr:Wzz/FepE/Etk N-terminal domain-containing protein [Gaiellaceae bacterium]